ncbi:MAG: ABC transporter ATP-binding protein [Candidatus Kerfeldbacteria bacterium]|nr:ABC transporter ATP-binding protein [Candidatus Kerfeldbacteria bacterium]
MFVAEIEHLSKIYGSGNTQVTAVNDVSLNVKKGDIMLIMGPSGSGKTTLITMIGALLKASKGKVKIHGKVLGNLHEQELAQLRLKELGFIFQSFNLLASLTAQENTAVPLIAAGKSKKEAMMIATGALQKLGLGGRLHNLPRDLSGGEKQRVSIARALVNNPTLILADEPTANLDSTSGHEVMKLLCSIACTENRSVVIVSHDMRLQEIAKTVIWFEDGQVIRTEKGQHNKHCEHHNHHA